MKPLAGRLSWRQLQLIARAVQCAVKVDTAAWRHGNPSVFDQDDGAWGGATLPGVSRGCVDIEARCASERRRASALECGRL